MLTFASFLLGTALFFIFPFFPSLSIVFFLSASAWAFWKRKLFLVVLVVAGFFYASFRFTAPIDSLDIWNRELRLTGRFVPEAHGPGAPESSEFVAEAAFDRVTGKEIRGLRGAEVGIFPDCNADCDRNYEIILKTVRDGRRLSPGLMRGKRPSGALLSAKQIGKAPFSIKGEFDKYRALINGYLLGRFSREQAALISAMTTGEMSYLDEDLKNAFNVTGLAHILSISGTHFGLFSVLTFGAFLFLIKRLPRVLLERLTIYLTPSQTAAILCLPVMTLYLGISGAGPPAVRSFVMVGIFLAGLLFGRKGFWLNSLFLAACILVLWDPGVLLSLSFQLSFLAVLFIGFSVGEKEGGSDEGNRLLRFMRSSVSLTFAATAGTSVLVAYHFHYFSVVSPLSNLLIAPFMGFVLLPSALISALSLLATGSYILGPVVKFSAAASIALVRLFAGVPFADVKIAAFPSAVCIFFYCGWLAYLLLGRKRRLLFLPFLPIFIYALGHAFQKRELTVTFLDVGQGDSEVIELPDRRTIVVDTGRTGRETAAFLRSQGKREIDALVLSHRHPDHTGGLPYLLSAFNVREVWDNGRIRYPGALHMKAVHRALARGDRAVSGDCSITVLHPYRGFYTTGGNEYEGENDSSLVLKVSGPRLSVLLTGDVGEEAEEDMVHLGGTLRSDVMKVPHHGGRTSAGDEFLSLVSPAIAVISVGRDNPFGHPSPEMLEKLRGKMLLRTDSDGAVEIRETERGPAVRTYAESGFRRAAGPADEWANVKRLFVSW